MEATGLGTELDRHTLWFGGNGRSFTTPVSALARGGPGTFDGRP